MKNCKDYYCSGTDDLVRLVSCTECCDTGDTIIEITIDDKLYNKASAVFKKQDLTVEEAILQFLILFEKGEIEFYKNNNTKELKYEIKCVNDP